MNTTNSGLGRLGVLAIVSVLIFAISIVASFVIGVGKKTRDTERTMNIGRIQKAIELYYDKFNTWPQGDNDGDGWDYGFYSKEDARFIYPLIKEGFLPFAYGDPKFYGNQALAYQVYDAGTDGCPSYKGKFYVLGITNLETDTRPPHDHAGSGFWCPDHNWQDDFDYVVGKYEKE
jgi:hypothetical protein